MKEASYIEMVIKIFLKIRIWDVVIHVLLNNALNN